MKLLLSAYFRRPKTMAIYPLRALIVITPWLARGRVRAQGLAFSSGRVVVPGLAKNDRGTERSTRRSKSIRISSSAVSLAGVLGRTGQFELPWPPTKAHAGACTTITPDVHYNLARLLDQMTTP